MSDTYEYTDSGGSVHKVDSLDQVPKQYLRSMTVTGGEDEAPAAKKSSPSGGTYSSTGLDVKLPGVPKGLEKVNPHYVVGALTILLVWKNKNFVVRCIIIVFAFCYAFINFYSWFESSPYTQPGEKIKKYNKPAQEQEQQEQR